jgi:hypothetical protein
LRKELKRILIFLKLIALSSIIVIENFQILERGLELFLIVFGEIIFIKLLEVKIW